MGEIAEMFLDGTMCHQCGTFTNQGNPGPGYPVLCAGCVSEARRENKKAAGGHEQKRSFGKIRVMGIHVNDRRERIQKYVHRGSKFALTREPDNKYDPNAILIELIVRGGRNKIDIGYVPREKAEEIAPLIDSGVEVKATFRAKIINEKNGNLIDLYLNLGGQ